MSPYTPRTILFVLPSAQAIGGVTRSAQRLIHTLKGMGHTVWSLHPDPDLFPHERKVEEGQWGFHLQGDLQHFTQETLVAIDTLKPDILVGWYASSGGFVATAAAVQRNIPVLVAARGNDIDLDFFLPQKHPLLRWTMEHASAITTVSSKMSVQIQSWFHRNTQFISNSVDTQLFYPDPQETERFQKIHANVRKPVLGIFGEFKPKRGLDLLSRIADEINHWQPLIIGSIRPNIIHQIPPHAIIIDYIKEIPLLRGAYGACDVVIQPSIHDGMPNVVLEALACGTNVLTSSAGGLPDISDGRHNAHICLSDLDWASTLSSIRNGDFSSNPLSLPTPQQEGLSFSAMFDQIISS
jgi:L-malate glycosyltransferase